jgi:hypothetical protein
MSADNAYFVWGSLRLAKWCVSHGFMSPYLGFVKEDGTEGTSAEYLEDLEERATTFDDFEEAYRHALDQEQKDTLVEYGVIVVGGGSEKIALAQKAADRQAVADAVAAIFERSDRDEF